jgi:Ribbon-helix-helix protein, copG family
MKKSSGKRPVGRPATGKEPSATLRLPKQALEHIGKMARDRGVSRSSVMRELILEALEARRR